MSNIQNRVEELELACTRFFTAYEKVCLGMEENPDDVVGCAMAIDERYTLIGAKQGKIFVITDEPSRGVFMTYVPEDEFTVGDVLCGYLDLLFPREEE